MAYVHNDVKIWDSREHYPIHAVTQENETSNYFPEKEKEEMDRMESKNDEA